jgi:selenide,water dikinase
MPERTLILAGGGHSHVLVLKALGDRPEPGLRVSVVSPDRFTTYSGMVPGVIGGQYALREAQIDVARLAERAGAAFVSASAVRVDAPRRVLELSTAAQLSYDLLSFDIGALAARSAAIDADAPVVAVKPIDAAIAAIEAFLASRVPDRRGIVVVGAGAGGCEVALALSARLRGGDAAITVCDEGPRPVPERGRRTSVLVARAFAEARITFVGGARVERLMRSGVRLTGGRELPAELIVWAAGASAPPLFAASQLPTDERGYLLVGDNLRCPAWPQIFAAGDCATLAGHPQLPKAGVYAVRQAPILERNLRAGARGDALRPFRPQKRFLALLNSGDGRAILSYGAIAWRGRAAWWLKDRIDRRFVGQFGGAG